MIRIVLAEDHAAIRQKLKRLLAQESNWQVSAETGNGLQVVRLVSQIKPDVLVTDLGLPGLHGLEVVRRVHRNSSRTRIVVASIHDDEQYVRQAVRNGALGYVRKDEVGRHLLPAIRSALAGKCYLSSSLAELAASPGTKQPSQLRLEAYDSLKSRERSALRLMAAGYTDAEIASHLQLTATLAGRLRFFLMRRLGLQTQTELTALARKKGLVATPRTAA